MLGKKEVNRKLGGTKMGEWKRRGQGERVRGWEKGKGEGEGKEMEDEGRGWRMRVGGGDVGRKGDGKRDGE